MVEWSIVERIKIIAAFVLIIAAIINLFGGALYTFTGASNQRITKTNDATDNRPNNEGAMQPSVTLEATQNDTASRGMVDGSNNTVEVAFKDKLWLMVGFWFGLLLLTMFVSQTIAAVMLFLSRSKKFVMWVGIFSLPTEIIGIYFFSFNLLRNGFGILCSILAIVGSTMINERQDATQSAKAP